MALTKAAPVAESRKVSGVKSLEVVATADNIAWLAATPELVQSARAASEFLFSALAVNKESQLDKLLTENFDPEQIWQQIDLQATPVLSMIKKSLRQIEKTPPGELVRLENKASSEADEDEELDAEALPAGSEEDEDDEELEDDDVFDNEEEVDESSKSEEEYSDYDEEEKKAVEDKFLKLSDMEKFLDRADAEDAGIAEDDGNDEDDDDDAEAFGEDDEEGDEEDLEMEEAFDFSARLADEDKDDEGWGPKYSEFIGKGKKQKPKPSRRQDSDDESEEDDLEGGDEDEDEDEEDDEEEPGTLDMDQQIQPVEERKLSAHERQQEKTKRRIEQLEKANLESKDWTMQGEVSASRRSKNSALEVELDFEHGARPAPVITEEVTQSLEDIIRSRIIESRYDDPQPRAAPITAAPKERIEMDEEKSKKGLGEIYEQEYMESTGLAVAATPAMETLKAEAKNLFKNLCYRLDALSHFHFAPKPTVEEMEVKVNVPALAMEEVAPLAISDASMLAPEEVYKSAGLVKGESELTPEERKRRRAQKKRKRKGSKLAEENLKKIRANNGPVKDPLKELNARSTLSKDNKRTTSSFSKSAKVFAELDKTQERGGNKSGKSDDAHKPALNASSLKL